MSINVPTVEVKLFESMVHAEYQAKGFKMRGKMRQRVNVVGSQVQFPIIKKGMATQKAIQDDVSPMNVQYDKRIATLADWNAAEYSDIFSQATINFDEKQELAKVCGMAIGRRMDQIALNALAASSTSNIIADGGVGFTFDKLRSVAKLFTKNNVSGKRYVAINASAESDLLAQDKLTNTFYVNSKVIPAGTVEGLTLFGVELVVFGDMDEGGIPVASNINTCYAWASDAVGYGIGIDFRTNIDWIPIKTSYLVNSVFKAGAVPIDDKGIIFINNVENDA